MLTLCMDTSHTLLVVSLIDDKNVVAKIQKECWKKQSEEIFPALEELLKISGKKVEDIDSIAITEGPGSYTGVRIAMTVAKVFAATKKIDLYTISTLQLYAGLAENALVLLDARGNRVYSAAFNNGQITLPLAIRNIDEIKEIYSSYQIIGDGHLVGVDDYYPDVAENFLALKGEWKKAENVHLVKPEYLKPNESYLVK